MKGKQTSKSKFDRYIQRPLLTSISTKNIEHPLSAIQQIQQKTQIIISQLHLQQQMKIYQWRIKTEFPIIKILDYKIIKKDPLRTSLLVMYQNYPIRLTELRQIPLFKILYLLKESIIGFERLYDKFGPFLVTSKMIALNSQHKCKIWLNENFASNHYIPCQMEQRQFLQMIYKIFIEISNQLKNTIHFFRELCQSNSFCQALSFIQNFARQNKISIPTICKINPKELSIIENKPKNQFNPSLTMTRSPKFLSSMNLRSSLKASEKKDFDNVFQRTIAMKKENEDPNQMIQMTETIQMKTSGDTAPDIYGSNTLSNSIQEQKQAFDQSIIFGEVEKETFKIPQSPLTFSKVGKRQLAVTRHMSENVDANTFFTSSKYSTKIDKNPYPHFKSVRQIQTQDDEEENIEKSTRMMANIFQKNKWEQTICGLFTEGDDMKKSAQHGVQKHRTENSSKRLLLLEKVSSNLHESFINDNDDHSPTKQF